MIGLTYPEGQKTVKEIIGDTSIAYAHTVTIKLNNFTCIAVQLYSGMAIGQGSPVYPPAYFTKNLVINLASSSSVLAVTQLSDTEYKISNAYNGPCYYKYYII